MISWFSSWFSELPILNFCLPANLQGKFISFVLKKTLGHFLKPGQLDSRQIDSQIGSGFVQITELELDNSAIDALLSDLPVILHDGHISSVTARVPWPNPLSSLKFSLDSLHLTFHLCPSASIRKVVDLTESMISVAESFIHDELTIKETSPLRPPIELSDSDVDIPGGLHPSPFLPNPDDVPPHDTDPPGVSMFGTLIERLLARLQFNATNIRITLVHPGNISVTVTISDIHYQAETVDDGDPSLCCVNRGSTSITGITLTSRNLREVILRPCRTGFPVHTPCSNSGKVLPDPCTDEETPFAMSQSVVTLPLLPSSSTNSIESSLYQSAISASPFTGSSTNEAPHSKDRSAYFGEDEEVALGGKGSLPDHSAVAFEEVTVVSFGLSPVVIEFSSSSDSENAQISVTTGIIAAAVSAWNIRGFIELLGELSQYTITASSTPMPSGVPSTDHGLNFSFQISGVVVLILLPPFPNETTHKREKLLSEYFVRPLIPPMVPFSYYRVFLDGITGDISKTEPNRTSRACNEKSGLSVANPDITSLSISDVSIFSIFESSTSASIFTSPVLLTDNDLSMQYTPHCHSSTCDPHQSLPSFEVRNWIDEESNPSGVDISAWRTKVRTTKDEAKDEAKAQLPSITVLIRQIPCREVRICSIPLHVFVDLGKAIVVESVMTFLCEALDWPSPRNHFHSLKADVGTNSDKGEAPSTRTKSGNSLEGSGNVDSTPFFDNGGELSTGCGISRRILKQKTSSSGVSVRIDMVRLQILCPPAPNSVPRSGAIVIDLHELNFSTLPSSANYLANVSESLSLESEENRKRYQSLIFESGVRRFVVACSPVGEHLANALLSSGPLELKQDVSSTPRLNTPFSAPLQPHLSVSDLGALSPGGPSVISVKVEIPSVHIDISKITLDTLQYWIDDVARFIAAFPDRHEFEQGKEEHEGHISRSFEKSRNDSENTSYETIIKVFVSEALVKANIPRVGDRIICPVVVHALDVDVLLEMKSEGRDQTVVTLSVMDLSLDRVQPPNSNQNFLSLTTQRSLTSASRSMIKLRYTSLDVPKSRSKESRMKLTLWGATFNVFPDFGWITDIETFSKTPPGTFESVVPSDRTSIQISLHDTSIRVFAPVHLGSMVAYVGDLKFTTDMIGDSVELFFLLSIPRLAFFAIDDIQSGAANAEETEARQGLTFWKSAGFALLAEVSDFSGTFKNTVDESSTTTDVAIDQIYLNIYLCADSLGTVTALANDISSVFAPVPSENTCESRGSRPTIFSNAQSTSNLELMASVDDSAFRTLPEIGPALDMIEDDLPTNMAYLDESFGAAAGLRELDDDCLDEFDDSVTSDISNEVVPDGTGVTSRIGGETIKVLRAEGIQMIDNYFDMLPPDADTQTDELLATALRLRVNDGNVNIYLHDGYDWLKTRSIIKNEVKEIRRRLTKIRQLVATGQSPTADDEETSSLLFNSVHIGLDHDVDELEPGVLLAAIDEELDDAETASQSSWQSLRPSTQRPTKRRSTCTRDKQFRRSNSSSMEFCLMGLKVEYDNFVPGQSEVSRVLINIRDVEILDHIKTSTWKKFLTELRSDSQGNIRETGSNMIRVELRQVHPVLGHPSQEARLRAKILPLRLYVDQDAVDFLKKFFNFRDPDISPPPSTGSDEIYFQLAEVFPVDLKLDYKPRRVDYRALKEGRTIELMNFFHFDGAEMTLRHITLAGITGWARFFELLNDLWTPDVKATQLVEVISGVAPIRSMVNVGSGVADLVLLPIAQYKKDGRIVRGVQKGTTAFVRSTATEAIRLGARLATGTQVILEQTESVLGGQFQHSITAEAVAGAQDDLGSGSSRDNGPSDISRYAQQPGNFTEGIHSAYKSLKKNLNSAAQTILAVPMEVYERSETEGPVRAVIRAVPIAVLKPMIGASEAVSKTLLGLHNSLNPDVRRDNEAKYKRPQSNYSRT